MRFYLLSSLLLSSTVVCTDAFSIPLNKNIISSVSASASASASASESSTNTISQNHNPRWFALNASPDNEHDNEEKLVTREMFLRDMLSDPDSASITDAEAPSAKVKRKKKNGSHFRTLDNRDSLPFLVQVATPDPYTSNEEMKKEAILNTEIAKKKGKKGKNGKNGDGGKTRHNLVGMDGKDSISSSIFTRGDDGSMHKVVGEFALDKSTNCGDVIEVGDGTEYRVQKSRCLYKYAGGQRFVMTKKILEVKEIKRILVEKEVKELFEKDIEYGSQGSDGPMFE